MFSNTIHWLDSSEVQNRDRIGKACILFKHYWILSFIFYVITFKQIFEMCIRDKMNCVNENFRSFQMCTCEHAQTCFCKKYLNTLLLGFICIITLFYSWKGEITETCTDGLDVYKWQVGSVTHRNLPNIYFFRTIKDVKT